MSVELAGDCVSLAHAMLSPPVGTADKNQLLRQLPSVDELLARPDVQALSARHGRTLLGRAVRRAVADSRQALLGGATWAPVELAQVATALETERTPGLRRVINASGVVLHTNLGRAPLAPQAAEAMRAAAEHYCNLELDLVDGARGSRGQSLIPLLTELTGAEDGLVVNNCAGATLLALSALAQGREAVVSRGELLEIGGGFRLPEVMAQGGVRLREVGTTNKTRLSDYAQAIGAETALLAKVHRANFAMLGFTEEVAPAALAELAHSRGLLSYEDLGSGSLTPSLGERTVQRAVADGADLVTFSGDKLLGGPQAGLAVGRAAVVARLAAHPLARALRIDKCTAAGLEATLRLHRDGRAEELPTLRLLTESEARVQQRAMALQAALQTRGVRAMALVSVARVGGGSLPLRELPSRALSLSAPSAEGLARALRLGHPAVVGRLEEGRVCLDLRAVADDELEPLATAVAAAFTRLSALSLSSEEPDA